MRSGQPRESQRVRASERVDERTIEGAARSLARFSDDSRATARQSVFISETTSNRSRARETLARPPVSSSGSSSSKTHKQVIKMNNSSPDNTTTTNPRINPFSIDSILSPPSSQNLQDAFAAAAAAACEPHPQLYYMAFMLQQLQQQQQHFRHLQHFQQQQQQQYFPSFFVLQQQLQLQQQQQQQQQQLLQHKHQPDSPQQQQQPHHTASSIAAATAAAAHHQLSHRHLLQAHQQQLLHQQQQQHQSQHATARKQSSQKSHHQPIELSPIAHKSASANCGAKVTSARSPVDGVTAAAADDQSTALSSLSSFVARIEPFQASSGKKSSAAAAATALGQSTSTNSSSKSSSGTSPAPARPKQSSSATSTSTSPATPTTPTAGKATAAAAAAANLTPPPPPLNGRTNTAITFANAPPKVMLEQPAWVFCTRYSDRPSSGPRTRKTRLKDKKAKEAKASLDEKRPRTAFTNEQLEKLRLEFQANSYLDEKRRKELAERLCLNENQIKIWFQNKRAKMKKQSNQPNPLRGLLVAGGLYNHSTTTSDCSESYANGNDHEDGMTVSMDDDNDEDDKKPPASALPIIVDS